MSLPIYTYADGRPIEGRPELPESNAPIAVKLEYIRQRAAYLDRCNDLITREFAKHFARAVNNGS